MVQSSRVIQWAIKNRHKSKIKQNFNNIFCFCDAKMTCKIWDWYNSVLIRLRLFLKHLPFKLKPKGPFTPHVSVSVTATFPGIKSSRFRFLPSSALLSASHMPVSNIRKSIGVCTLSVGVDALCEWASRVFASIYISIRKKVNRWMAKPTWPQTILNCAGRVYPREQRKVEI